MKNVYLELLENMEDLTDSQRKILLCITTYLNEEELSEFENYNKSLNISIKDSLNLKNIQTDNARLNELLQRFKKYVNI